MSNRKVHHCHLRHFAVPIHHANFLTHIASFQSHKLKVITTSILHGMGTHCHCWTWTYFFLTLKPQANVLNCESSLHIWKTTYSQTIWLKLLLLVEVLIASRNTPPPPYCISCHPRSKKDFKRYVSMFIILLFFLLVFQHKSLTTLWWRTRICMVIEIPGAH